MRPVGRKENKEKRERENNGWKGKQGNRGKEKMIKKTCHLFICKIFCSDFVFMNGIAKKKKKKKKKKNG